MPHFNKLTSGHGDRIRICSVVNVIASPLLCFLMTRHVGFWMFLCAVCVSTSILLMVPDTYNDGRLSEFLAYLTLVAASAVSTSAGYVSSEEWLVTMFLATASVPLSICMAVRTCRMMRDVKYLTMKVSGWEMMLFSLKYCFLTFFMIFSYGLGVCSFMLASSCPPLQCVALLISAVFYVIVLVRSMTSGPIVFYSAAGTPVCETDVETCVFVPEKARSDYQYVYDKMCRYLEKEKPYLNPSFSLDEMVSALCSNKSYVSRLVNSCTGMNFSQLVNRYRVDYARGEFMKNPDLKVKDLSDMAGFHSQVSFNMAFKLFYDITPGVWCKETRDGIMAAERLSSQTARGQ